MKITRTDIRKIIREELLTEKTQLAKADDALYSAATKFFKELKNATTYKKAIDEFRTLKDKFFKDLDNFYTKYGL